MKHKKFKTILAAEACKHHWKVSVKLEKENKKLKKELKGLSKEYGELLRNGLCTCDLALNKKETKN